jgi:hypothetical protein
MAAPVGQKCVTLLRHLSQNKSDPIPPYRADLVREVLVEMNSLYEDNQKDL